ncbi:MULTISPECIES: cytochrome P450 [Streptomyces]|uniref:Cytochrome P450 n=1 Tax=Streptomyces lonegramiae TaxID=3075524 RepID=A0ABU2XAH4_9ACTN|nr:cytochrome P450 [Streptomyces sp. DSM 41529]MDT0542832.1 cytochrome P450 [Streptomyces sp. DSM 41529]
MDTRRAPAPQPPDQLDLADPLLHAHHDLGPLWRRLRTEAPVHWQPETARGPGFWVVSRYTDVVSVLNDSETFTSERGNVLDTLLAGGDSAAGKMLAVTDGRPHQALRSALLKPFSPRSLEVVVDSVRRGTHALVEEAVERGEVDFAADVAAHIPLAAICDLLGVPASERRHIIDLTSGALSSADGAPTEEATWASRNGLLLYFSELAAQRRAKPYDDVVSLLVTREIDGRPLTHEEIVFNCYSIIMGGHETTRFAMVGGLHALMEREDQWQALSDGRAEIAPAVEEVLRWTTPALHSGRTATRDVLLDDRFVEEGDIVVTWLASANRDERVFDRPDDFDLSRTPNKHLSFAHGSHFCLGAFLARAELTALLESLRQLVAKAEPAGPPRYVYSNFLSGMSALPVALTPSCRVLAGPVAWEASSAALTVGNMTHTPAAVGAEAVSPVVCGMVRLVAPRKLDQVELDHRLVGDLGFHSLVLAELGYNLEDLYGLRTLTPEETMKLERVRDVIEFVSTEVAGGRAQLPPDDEVAALFARYGADAPAAPTA